MAAPAVRRPQEGSSSPPCDLPRRKSGVENSWRGGSVTPEGYTFPIPATCLRSEQMAKQASSGTFVGRTSTGGLIRHADNRGLKGASKTIKDVGAKNEAKAAQARRALRSSR